MGRKTRAEAPSTLFWIRLSPFERARLKEAADANRQKLSDFARDALVIAIEDILETADGSDAR